MKRLLSGLIVAVGIVIVACTKNPAAPTLNSVVLSGNANFVNKNQTSQLTATANFSNSTTQDVTNAAQWTSSNSTIATVTSTGLVTAVGNGTATITAAYQGNNGTLSVTVTLKADPQVSAIYTRLCFPFRARLTITASEASGNVGMTINSMSSTMTQFGGALGNAHTFTSGEMTVGFGSLHFAPLQSRVMVYDATFPGGVDTMDSTASVTASFTDDLGNTKTVSYSATHQSDGC